MAKKKEDRDIYQFEKSSPRWPYIFLGVAIAGVLFIAIVIGSVMFIGALFGSVTTGSGSHVGSGNIVVIPVTGPIIASSTPALFAEAEASSQTIVNWIKRARENSDVEAIIFEINSPGGSPVASDEIVQAIKETEKPTIAVIREVGASGAYWVASATDYIFANRMSVTGSIGVLGSGLEFGGLLEEYNITYRRIVSGKYKDTGTPLRDSTQEERELLQGTVDQIYEIFVRDVAENRDLPVSKVRELATGYIYLGVEAKDLQLIDDLGGMDDAIAFVEDEYGISGKLVRYGAEPTLFDLFGKVSARAGYSVGFGLADAVSEQEQIGITV